ncbi:unnamed protein product [Staurois parvus]|uniref:Uncharacterized protein n=1 Tax=Staurois parvus TaxID=386267 RepID=A0ABN9AMD2_9NEOB|nr:unnamed protein product [Staurois parvus]
MERPVRIPGQLLSSAAGPYLFLYPAAHAVFPTSVVWALGMTAGCQVHMCKKRCFL